jgi:phage-related protein
MSSKKYRHIVAYGPHFEAFLQSLDFKVQNKVFKVLEAIELLERIPETYLKYVDKEEGLYEIRIQWGSNIWRLFCFFSSNNSVALLHGFSKKTQKVPRKEISKAAQLKKQYQSQQNTGC